LQIDLGRWGWPRPRLAALAPAGTEGRAGSKGGAGGARGTWHHLVGRVAMQRAAEWLDSRKRLGRYVFGREGTARPAPVNAPTATSTTWSGPASSAAPAGPGLRIPAPSPVLARVRRGSANHKHVRGTFGNRKLSAFLPAVDTRAPNRELRCRAAPPAALAGLEMARPLWADELHLPTFSTFGSAPRHGGKKKLLLTTASPRPTLPEIRRALIARLFAPPKLLSRCPPCRRRLHPHSPSAIVVLTGRHCASAAGENLEQPARKQ